MKTNNSSPAGPKNLTNRLGAYSAAAAATVATTNSADAAHILHDIPDVTVVGIQPGLLFNVITGGTAAATASAGNTAPGSFRIANYAYPPGTVGTAPYIAGPAGSTLAGFMGLGVFASGVNVDASNLLGGSSVSVGKNFAANVSYPSFGNYAYLNANFTDTQGFVGLQFEIAGALHYGWAEVTFNGAANTITLHSFGYNDEAGDPSITGIPEPSSALLFALGAAGLGMRRNRKQS